MRRASLLRAAAVLGLAGLPVLRGAPAATIPTGARFSVGATVQNGCLVAGNPAQTAGLAFGQIGFGTWPALATGRQTAALGPAGGSQALLQCTAGTTVQLLLDAGQHALGSQRRLANGAGYFLPYDLTLASTGNQPVLPNVAVGLALGATPQALPLQGSVVLPGTGVAAGTYTDTVQVTVSW